MNLIMKMHFFNLVSAFSQKNITYKMGLSTHVNVCVCVCVCEILVSNNSHINKQTDMKF